MCEPPPCADVVPAAQPASGQVAEAARAFEQMPLLMGSFAGPEHVLLAVNAAFRARIGHRLVLGLPMAQASSQQVAAPIIELLDRVQATGTVQSAQEWRVHSDRDGAGTAPREVYVDLLATPRLGPDGRVLGVTLHGIDVTERALRRDSARVAAAEGRYQAAVEVVLALQQALLPAALPMLPQLRLAARYLVAADHQVAGGDWFDAIPLPGGCVALLIGDLVGHGISASTGMGRLRAVIEVAFHRTPDLEEVLAETDRFAARHRDLQATTVLAAVLDPATGVLRYATCGHPAPLVIGPDGSTRYLPASGAGPLGTGAEIRAATAALDLEEMLVLYSDGLIEGPHRSLAAGLAELAAIGSDAVRQGPGPGTATVPAERVAQMSVDLLTRTGISDDITVLVAHRLGEPVPALHLDLPALPGTLHVAREQLRQWLTRLGPDPAQTALVEIAVGEAVANAAEHAYPPGQPGRIHLHAALHPDGMTEIRVTDTGTWRIPDISHTHRGRGLLLAGQLVEELSLDHLPADAAHGEQEPPGRGTVVRVRHRLHRPAILAPTPIPGRRPLPTPASRPYTTELEPGSSAPRLRVAGPIDITTAEDLEQELLRACRGATLNLEIDLSEVTHLHSAGVALLHRLRDKLQAQHRELRLLTPPGSTAATVLDLVRLPHTTISTAPNL